MSNPFLDHPTESTEPGGGPIDLSQFDADYEGAQPEERTYKKVTDGKYIAKVEKVELKKSKNEKNMLAWQLRIIQGEFQGSVLFRNNMIATPENLKWLKGDLQLCGLELTKLSDLPDRIGELLDVTLEVQVVNRGDNQNVYLNRRLTESEAASANTAADNVGDGFGIF